MDASQLSAEYLSPEQFARATGLSLSTVHRYLQAGKVPHSQPGGRRHRVLIPANAAAILAKTGILTAPADAEAINVEAASNKVQASRRKRAPAWLQRKTTQGLYTNAKAREK